MKEIWKSIPGMPKYYQVSSLGKVRKEIADKIYKELNQTRCGKVWKVSCDGKQYAVHKLVADAFVINPDSEQSCFIKHIDGDYNNNRADNLTWKLYADQDQAKHLTIRKDTVVHCKELDTYYQNLLSADYCLGIPREAITYAITTGKMVCGLHFTYMSFSDVPDTSNIIHISRNQIIKICENAKSTKDLQKTVDIIDKFSYN